MAGQFPMCGGINPQANPATPEIQKLADDLRKAIEEKAGKQFTVFVATHYKTQVVAGTNYFIKIHVGDDEYLHVRVFKPLDFTNASPEAHSIQMQKTAEDKITYF